MKNQACCFSGHRDIPYNNKNKIKRLLKKEITKLIKAGVKIFIQVGRWTLIHMQHRWF